MVRLNGMQKVNNIDKDGSSSTPATQPPFEKIRLKNSIEVWRSPLLSSHGVTHAFTTRNGGTSIGPRASLDLAGRGSRIGDDLMHAEENLRRLREALELDNEIRVVRLHQVHGAKVHIDDGHPELSGPPRADVAISNHRDGLLMVRVADCTPILIHDPETGTVAAVHAGWRGTVADAAGAAVDAMVATFGTTRSDLIAAIGPAIGLERFEVGEEVAEEFRLKGLGAFIHPREPRPHIDLFGAVKFRLLEAGVPAEHIEGTPICSFDNPDTCFSYRRDGPDSGRMAAVILATPRS